MQFGHPETLSALLICIAVMVLSVIFYVRWRSGVLKRFGEHPMLAKMADRMSTQKYRARIGLFFLAAVCVGIAAARPQWGLTNKPIKRTGVDVVFALDISKSMLARDAAPNRLDAAKTEIKELMRALAGDRVGLVVFTAVSFPQAPLTADYGAIRFYLDKLDPAQMPVGGTSIGRAIMDGVSLLTGTAGEDEAPTMKRAKNQIIVLISDGEDHESAPLEAADSAAAANVRIVTVGFGSATGERIPLYKQDGTLMGYQRDRSGEIVRTRLDVKTLEGIAERTGGIFIPYAGKNSVARAVADFIGELEKSELESLLKERYQERFMFFLIPGFIFLLAGLMLGERKRIPKITVVAACFFILSCDNALRDTDSDVDRGNAMVEAAQFDDALLAYDKAEKRTGLTPEISYGRGLAHLGAGRFDEAQSAFARALETPDPQLRLKAMFNLGVALSKKESWKEAHGTFRDALVYASENPGIATPEQINLLRKNLEWTYLQLHPPCAKIDDSLEENDTKETAASPEKTDAFAGVACPNDGDWFRLPVIPGSRVSITVKFKNLRDDFDPDEPFAASPQDFNVALFDSAGGPPIAQIDGTDASLDTEIKERKATRSLNNILLSPTQAQDGAILLRILSKQEAAYDVEVLAIPPCAALQEASEPNDDPDQAAALGSEPAQGHLCFGDSDWYSMDLFAGESLFVDVAPAVDVETGLPPLVDVEIIDAERGIVVGQSIAEGALVTAGLRDTRQSGRYLIHVKPKSGKEQGPYSLTAYKFAACPDGDDRLEDNDDAGSASELDGSQPTTRYLRLCDNDLDFFKVPIDPKKKRLNLGLSLISTPSNLDDPVAPAIRIDRMSPSGDQIVQAGMRPLATDPAAVPLESVLVEEDVTEESVIVRVSGDSDFYHLVLLDGAQGESDDKGDQKEESDKQDKPGDEPDPSEEQKDEGEPNKPQDDAPPEDKEGGDEEEKSADKGDSAPEEKPDNEGEKGAAEEKQGDEEKDGKEGEAQGDQATDVEMQRIDDILKALESSDDNFQMRKALKEQPNRFIDKDW
jgi:Ca-activated chloride channel family protein